MCSLSSSFDSSDSSFDTLHDQRQVPSQPLWQSPLNDHTHPSTRVFTYSNHLGILSEDDPEFRAGRVPRGHPYLDNLLNAFNTAKPGPSRSHSNRAQLQGYTVESSWKRDAMGRLSYVGHGTIQEVGDNIDEDTETLSSPRPSSFAILGQDEQESFGDIMTEPLPPGTTPPPRPEQAFMHLLPTLTGDRYLGTDYAVHGSSMFHPPSAGPLLGETSDFTLLSDNLLMIEVVSAAIENIRLNFVSLTPFFEMRPHLKMCLRVTKSLLAVKEALDRRSNIDDMQWGLRSPLWQDKYRQRLHSLYKTLQRLKGLERLVNDRRPKENQLNAILNKLLDHEAKLLDLSSKFNTSFDRLKVRHLHALLSEAHAEARQKQERQLANRESFQRRWYEGKVKRAGLRREFYMYHAGRLPNAM